MLLAKKKDGSILSLLLYSRSEIEKQRHEEFFCPCCEGRVYLKIGTMKIPHFAHKSHTFCRADAEGESLEHLQGKKQLFEWLRQSGMDVQMEKYFPEFKQRADLYIVHNGQGYAIEFQCSVVSQQIIQKRTQHYLQHQIIPLWILNSKLVKKKKQNEYSLSSFQYFCSSGTILQPKLLTYSPTQKQFTLLQQLLPFSTRNTFAYPMIISQERLTFVQLIQKSNIVSIDSMMWMKKKQSWRAHVLTHANFQDSFVRAMYENKIDVVSFPMEIGLPVPYIHLYETNAVVWQFWLYEKVLRHKRVDEVLTLQELKSAFIQCLKEKKIVLRLLPTLESINPFLPLQQYVNMLERLGVLRHVGNQIYKVKRLLENFNLHSPQRERVFFEKVGNIYNQLMEIESVSDLVKKKV